MVGFTAGAGVICVGGCCTLCSGGSAGVYGFVVSWCGFIVAVSCCAGMLVAVLAAPGWLCGGVGDLWWWSSFLLFFFFLSFFVFLRLVFGAFGGEFCLYRLVDLLLVACLVCLVCLPVMPHLLGVRLLVLFLVVVGCGGGACCWFVGPWHFFPSAL